MTPKTKHCNKNLQNAQKAKRDEFYTMYKTVADECAYYADQFRNKVIYCNCDNPHKSKFTRYFARNFNKLGLKRLISTSYEGGDNRGLYLDITSTPQEWTERTPDAAVLAYIAENTRELDGSGDFTSFECVQLLRTADIVVTNPPFSIISDFFDTIQENQKQFLIVCHNTVIRRPTVFPRIATGEYTIGKGGRGSALPFMVPQDKLEYIIGGTVGRDGKIFRQIPARWLTNLKNPYTPPPLKLRRFYDPRDYPTYDNSDIIEVSGIKDIPLDYGGLMGLPITFMDRWNPEQFEVVGKCIRPTIRGRELFARVLVRHKHPARATQTQQNTVFTCSQYETLSEMLNRNSDAGNAPRTIQTNLNIFNSV